jgi:site-specific DNA recombinase
MSPETRDALLAAIAKALGWIEDLRLGRVATLVEIADRESLGERHVRLLAPLAFVSPVVVAAIVDGAAPVDLTVTGLAKALPHSWAAAGTVRKALRAHNLKVVGSNPTPATNFYK